MPNNTAAWLIKQKNDLEIRTGPYVQPKDNEIVVMNHAVAINPIDWIIQLAGNIALKWVKLPFVIGMDVAGEVVETGRGVTRFK